MPALPFGLPDGLLGPRAEPGWDTWLAGLPRLAAGLVEDWRLRYDGPPASGRSALVLPVRSTSGAPAVLKVRFPHEAAEHEHLALQHWHGNGAVRLLRADPHRSALLLERLHREDLGDLWDVQACEVVAGLYRRLHVPAPPQLRPLTAPVSRWTERLRALPRQAPVPRRLVEQAVALGAAFADDPASTGTMVHSDLHYGTVLAADREPWLAIGPKPLSGDPHYEVAPLLWHRWDDVVASGDVRGTLRNRFFAAVDAAGLDEDRARDWVVVRTMHRALRAVEEGAGPGDGDRRDELTRCVTVAKAVQG